MISHYAITPILRRILMFLGSDLKPVHDLKKWAVSMSLAFKWVNTSHLLDFKRFLKFYSDLLCLGCVYFTKGIIMNLCKTLNTMFLNLSLLQNILIFFCHFLAAFNSWVWPRKPWLKDRFHAFLWKHRLNSKKLLSFCRWNFHFSFSFHLAFGFFHFLAL